MKLVRLEEKMWRLTESAWLRRRSQSLVLKRRAVECSEETVEKLPYRSLSISPVITFSCIDRVTLPSEISASVLQTLKNVFMESRAWFSSTEASTFEVIVKVRNFCFCVIICRKFKCAL